MYLHADIFHFVGKRVSERQVGLVHLVGGSVVRKVDIPIERYIVDSGNGLSLCIFGSERQARERIAHGTHIYLLQIDGVGTCLGGSGLQADVLLQFGKHNVVLVFARTVVVHRSNHYDSLYRVTFVVVVAALGDVRIALYIINDNRVLCSYRAVDVVEMQYGFIIGGEHCEQCVIRIDFHRVRLCRIDCISGQVVVHRIPPIVRTIHIFIFGTTEFSLLP